MRLCYHKALWIGLVTRMDLLSPLHSSHVVVEFISFGQSEPETLNMRE